MKKARIVCVLKDGSKVSDGWFTPTTIGEMECYAGILNEAMQSGKFETWYLEWRNC